MKQYLILLLLIFASFHGYCQTYFYKFSSVQENGVKKAGDNSGIFLTFTKTGCYISDKNGISDNSGFMRFDGQNSNVLSFQGSSHCGPCNFYISKDYSLLNIAFGDVVMVYKKTQPNGVAKSSFCRKYVNYANHKSQPDNFDQEIRNHERYMLQEQMNLYKKEWVDCASCGGSGKCNWCAGRGYTIVNGTMMDCTLCHGGGQCASCHGQGGRYL